MQGSGTGCRFILMRAFFVLALSTAPAAGFDGSPITAPAPLAALIAEGLDSSQKLQSQRSKIDALYDEAKAAGALDDPMLGVALLNLPTDTFAFDQEPMTQKQISLSQKFPWFGKLDLKTQIALLEAKKQEADWQLQRLELARMIADAYYELAQVVRSEQINVQLIDLVTRLLDSSASRYSTGNGLQQDVLQAQVQLSRLMDEQYQLAERREIIDSRINELINRPVAEEVAVAAEIPLPSLDMDRETLKTLAQEKNPRILSLVLDREQKNVAVELARKDFYPNFDTRLAYGFREDDPQGDDRADFFSIGVNLNVPLWQGNKQKPRLEAAIKRRNAAGQALQEIRLSLPHRIDGVIDAMERLVASHDLYENTLLLQTRQWADSAQSAYEVGKLEFNTLISARIQVLRMNLQADIYKLRIYQKRAELEVLIGGFRGR